MTSLCILFCLAQGFGSIGGSSHPFATQRTCHRMRDIVGRETKAESLEACWYPYIDLAFVLLRWMQGIQDRNMNSYSGRFGVIVLS